MQMLSRNWPMAKETRAPTATLADRRNRSASISVILTCKGGVWILSGPGLQRTLA